MGCDSGAGIVSARGLETSNVVINRKVSFVRGSYHLVGKISSSENNSISASGVGEACLTDF